MKGNIIILIIVAFVVIALLLTWFWMQVVIKDFEVEQRALSEAVNYMIKS
ncbi:hypothetical protein [Oceanobacillus massiliensis]|nr:hypothetical protein [Oceanobacillus massiliensis]